MGNFFDDVVNTVTRPFRSVARKVLSTVGEITGIDEINIDKQIKEGKEEYARQIKEAKAQAIEMMKSADAQMRAKGRASMRKIEREHAKAVSKQNTQKLIEGQLHEKQMDELREDLETQAKTDTPTTGGKFDRKQYFKSKRQATLFPTIRRPSEVPEMRPGEQTQVRPK